MMLVLLKPKLCGSKLQAIANKLWFPNCMHGNPINSHIWILWKNEVSISIEIVTEQSITMDVNIPFSFQGKFTAVYANCNRLDRMQLWDELIQLSNTFTAPWIDTWRRFEYYCYHRRKERRFSP